MGLETFRSDHIVGRMFNAFSYELYFKVLKSFSAYN